ncbi:serine/threonine kinase-like protein, putative [Leishmania tarentolae]|uniref:Serine/threonine kinase-like protein, putative n=1 Tax=Leishmania tarentolae TaxID=5689 RepID=A0A640KFB4_LEITA|nr:serine/threonine kinase-like protein, putative [Leishmania tarentolae]
MFRADATSAPSRKEKSRIEEDDRRYQREPMYHAAHALHVPSSLPPPLSIPIATSHALRGEHPRIPVNLKPRVVYDILHRDALARVHGQHARYEVLGRVADVANHLIVAPLNFAKKDVHVSIFKWQTSRQHHIQNNATAPDVCRESVVSALHEYLRRNVVWRAADRLQKHILLKVAESKVGNLQCAVRVEQQVLRLQVAVGEAL